MYFLNLQEYDKSINRRRTSLVILVFYFCLNVHVSPPQTLYSLSPAIWSFFLTLTRSRCRLTTASESRLRHYRWVVFSQWPGWCSHSFESSHLTEIYGSLSKEELCDVALGLVGEIVFICSGDGLCLISGIVTCLYCFHLCLCVWLDKSTFSAVHVSMLLPDLNFLQKSVHIAVI